MTGENTRLDVSGIDTKYRSESRYNYPRRRATKISYSHSGSYENDLALAVQESLLMAKQAEAEKRNSIMEDNSNKQNCTGFPDAPDENIVKEKKCSESVQSSKYLKELLLINLDLVQHQQELIAQKDKEIKTLKSEKNALQCRLDRMERRMSLLKQKEESESTSPFARAFTAHAGRIGAASPVVKKIKSEIIDEDSQTEKGLKRKASMEAQNLNKKFVGDNDVLKYERTDRAYGKLSLKHKRRTASAIASTEVIDSSAAQKTRQKSGTVSTYSEEDDVKTRNKRTVSNIIKDSGSDGILRTKDLYYVSYYEPIADQIDLSSRKDIMNNAEAQLQVETPHWKPRKYPSLWVLEGTENLEDEVFVKRHQKYEIEEKRRKRWDLQRMREQKVYDKLREKEVSNQKQEDATIESFYPSLEDITHIEVIDKVPVMAFGHPLPNLQTIEFELPWEVGAKPSTSSASRTGRASRHR